MDKAVQSQWHEKAVAVPPSCSLVQTFWLGDKGEIGTSGSTWLLYCCSALLCHRHMCLLHVHPHWDRDTTQRLIQPNTEDVHGAVLRHKAEMEQGRSIWRLMILDSAAGLPFRKAPKGVVMQGIHPIGTTHYRDACGWFREPMHSTALQWEVPASTSGVMHWSVAAQKKTDSCAWSVFSFSEADAEAQKHRFIYLNNSCFQSSLFCRKRIRLLQFLSMWRNARPKPKTAAFKPV